MDSQRRVFYDDTCELCEKAVRTMKADIDLSAVGASGELPETIDKEDLMRELHAMDENGVLYKGIDAVIVILRWHPRLFWLAPIVAAPGVRQIAAAGYRVVAANRRRWFRRR